MADYNFLKLKLIDGLVDGIMRIETPTSIAYGYRIPRSKISECKTRDEIDDVTSIYFLFGGKRVIEQSDGTTHRVQDLVYVGQAGLRNSGENIFARLSEHNRTRSAEEWDEAIVISKQVGRIKGCKANELNHLEKYFYDLALESNNYFVLNDPKHPPQDSLLDDDEIPVVEEMKKFTIFTLGVLGYDVFKPAKETIYYKGKGKKKAKSDNSSVTDEIETELVVADEDPFVHPVKGRKVPKLNESIESTCTFVKNNMKALAESGFVFSDEEIEFLCNKKFTAKYLKNSKASHLEFFYPTRKDKDRYWATPFKFGDKEFYLMSQWDNHDKSRANFIKWYYSLGKIEE